MVNDSFFGNMLVTLQFVGSLANSVHACHAGGVSSIPRRGVSGLDKFLIEKLKQKLV